MRLLVLAWDARGRDGGPAPQTWGLAGALAAAGDEVRVVTRHGEDGPTAAPVGVELHAVADAPPIIPAALDEPLLAAEAFAARAMAVATRRLDQAPVDAVHAVGWQAGPVVAGLRQRHDVPVVATLTARDVLGQRDGRLAAATAGRLAEQAGLVLAPTRADAEAVTRVTGRPVEVVGPGVELPARSPGPPPPRAPLHLVAPPGADHRSVAAAVRSAAGRPRTITRSWRRRPFAVAVLDPGDVDAAVRALARGVPLLAAAGPVGELATRSGGGLLVDPTGAAVAAVVDRLAADPALATALGQAGAAAALAHGWGRVAAAWRSVVARHLAPGTPHLHAAG